MKLVVDGQEFADINEDIVKAEISRFENSMVLTDGYLELVCSKDESGKYAIKFRDPETLEHYVSVALWYSSNDFMDLVLKYYKGDGTWQSGATWKLSGVPLTPEKKVTNKTAISIAFLGGVFVLVFFLAPEERLEAINKALRYVTAPKVNECLDVWQDRFVDPDSIMYLSSYERHEGAWHSLNIKYKAKNSYGAWVSNYLTCGLDGEGKIDRSETYNYMTKEYYGLIGDGPGDYPEAAAPAPATPVD